MNYKYLAHSKTTDHPEGQPLREHLENVADLTSDFCSIFGAEEDGRLCGLYHDVGKYSEQFQRRLAGSGEKVDHSSAGAVLLFEKRNIPVSMCIAGHHSGLPDMGTRFDFDGTTFMSRINRARKGYIEDFSAWEKEIPPIPDTVSRSLPDSRIYYYIKMLFSALTDADWLDTDAYFNSRDQSCRKIALNQLLSLLNRYIEPWWNAKTDLNKRRCAILKAAIDHGEDTPGVFSMTVPTGGGKTISSMAFALNHAVKHRMRRIIYVIPYCSILEQTESVFDSIFGKEYVTSHYSGAEFTYDENSLDSRAFSSENWDSPIILTTAVQFFESIFSCKPSKNRKLHNIAGSVIIFDEAQMLPIPFSRPCLDSICKLTELFRCSAVLCTATQPSVGRILKDLSPDIAVRELCPEPEKMYEDFQRVTYLDDGMMDDETLKSRIRVHPQVLCIVNSRRQAQKLYNELNTEIGEVFHLSTMMIPSDRKRVLSQIRACLKNGDNCRVISTSLIEAGVDVDFPVVYRAIAGLDSIIQAGGRCNREGLRSRSESVVHIFRSEAKAPRMIEKNISSTERVLNGPEDADSPSAVRRYFEFLLYTLKGAQELDEKDILPAARQLRFRSIADRFRLIDGAGFTIYVPIERGAELSKKLASGEISRNEMRELDQFAVSVYQQFFNQLEEQGMLNKISDTAAILMDTELYSRETGLPFRVGEESGALFV